MKNYKFLRRVKAGAKDDTSIGNILVKSGAITKEDIAKAIEFQQENRDVVLGETLVRLGLIKEHTLEATILKQKAIRGNNKKAVAKLVKLATKHTREATEEMHLFCQAIQALK